MGGEDFVPTIEEVREDEEDGEDAEGLRTAEGLKETGNELFKGGEYEKSLVSCRNYYFGGGGDFSRPNPCSRCLRAPTPRRRTFPTRVLTACDYSRHAGKVRGRPCGLPTVPPEGAVGLSLQLGGLSREAQGIPPGKVAVRPCPGT